MEITAQELEYFKKVEMFNDMVVIKPETKLRSKLLSIQQEKEQFRNRGIVVASGTDKVKVGDIVVWSITAFPNQVTIDELVDSNVEYSGKYIMMSLLNIWFVDKNEIYAQEVKG
jgi:hypothetical protein